MTDLGKCKICGTNETTVFLTRMNTPVHQNLVYRDQKAALSAVKGDLSLHVCPMCNFIVPFGEWEKNPRL